MGTVELSWSWATLVNTYITQTLNMGTVVELQVTGELVRDFGCRKNCKPREFLLIKTAMLGHLVVLLLHNACGGVTLVLKNWR